MTPAAESEDVVRHEHNLQAPVPPLLSGQVIRELSVLKPSKALLAIAVEWFAIIKIIALCQLTHRPGIYLFAVIWIGARQHALSILGHEAVHFRLVPSKKWNDWIADIFTQWPMFLTVEGFREFHGRHHRFLGQAGDGNRRIWRTHNAAAEIYWPFGPEKAPSRPLRIHRVLRGKDLIIFLTASLPHCEA